MGLSALLDGLIAWDTPCEFEIQVLRAMNGENVEGLSWGAGMSVAARVLKAHGYAEGTYTITQKGKDFLASLPPPPAAEG